MTIITVLVGYTTLVATLALGISLLILRLVHTGALTPATGRATALPASGPPVGSSAPPFTARTSTAALLASADLSGQSYLLAFLSSDCAGCLITLPALLGYSSELRDRQRLITVIVGNHNARAEEIEQRLGAVATVVAEPAGGPIATAFGITLFPSYVLVSETGTVLATGQSVLDLPQPQRQ